MVDVSEKMIEAGLNAMHRFMSDPYEASPELAERIYTAMHSAREVDGGTVERCARIAESHATCGCNGKHGACMVDDLANSIAADIRAIAAMGEGDVR